MTDTNDTWTVAGRIFTSRLIVGTGKYKDFAENAAAVEASGAEIVTVAVRRVNISDPSQPVLMDFIDPKKITYLPNTAGCFTGDEAVRTLRLAREAGGWTLVKLEVLGEARTLYPDMVETLRATEILAKEGFEPMVYCADDPIAAKRLEDAGAVAIMPLGAPIGSGLGLQNQVMIRLIIEGAKVPVLVDAGVGTASDAAVAMELGCDGSEMLTRRTATVTISAPLASTAAAFSAKSLYLPVPTISREVKLRPATVHVSFVSVTAQPPPTKWTISKRSPSATRTSPRVERGTISRLRSTATRLGSRPSCSTISASVTPAITPRASPLMITLAVSDTTKLRGRGRVSTSLDTNG